jgi:hypothetical protein
MNTAKCSANGEEGKFHPEETRAKTYLKFMTACQEVLKLRKTPTAMSDSRFTPKERGVDAESRQTSTEPNANDSRANARRPKAKETQQQGLAKGVIFLLSREGHQRYRMQSGDSAPMKQGRRKAPSYMSNTLLLRDNMNASLRTTYNVSYDRWIRASLARWPIFLQRSLHAMWQEASGILAR